MKYVLKYIPCRKFKMKKICRKIVFPSCRNDNAALRTFLYLVKRLLSHFKRDCIRGLVEDQTVMQIRPSISQTFCIPSKLYCLPQISRYTDKVEK